ncbi:MAG: six-hairpin glycosidase [Candidatus Pedobacter colombiensis]|uniref:Six-hairpin glycosidase n=1 Tax=Candidatus Pedobacter colombiensis TaxID=3121371 RepID=A0AAJ5W655_9SPHI|nr:six-hairpin glycosidase [Pedobacter sp.]WEK17699.1 MAG: six-hairpin glycosidase [Pedobacter sp.]
MKIYNKIWIASAIFISVQTVQAQDTVRYIGKTLVNADYHHGQLVPVMGVHSIQTFRANREHPELSEGFGWTYNHAPMLAYWNNTFYVEYLSDKVGESIPPGQTLLQSSKDGYSWTKPDVIFPVYRIPDGTTKEGHQGVAKDLDAVMHQRMGFYVAKNNTFLVLGFYGISFDAKDDPNDGKGIGRAVREILPDGKYGPIYFVHYNPGYSAKNTSYPYYTSSKNKKFVAACNELLANKLITQQWNEESDRNDPLITLKKQYKAFSYYHLPDGRVVGLWKNALTAISKDNGKSWPENAFRAPGFVNSNAKIWGQKTSDGSYATVYNPSEYRWPLAISTSKNGLEYTNLLLVNGEIAPMRYGGNYKSYGPQYVRGIIEGNGVPPEGKMWVTYSMNKEDIWVSSIPVPVKDKADQHVNEVFNTMPAGKELEFWNIYSPLWAPVKIATVAGNTKALVLADKDPFDYAKAERLFPSSKKIVASFSVTPMQDDKGLLEIELQDTKGTASVRLTFDSTGTLSAKAGARYKNFMKYKAGENYDIKVKLNTADRFYTVTVNGKDVLTSLAFVPVAEVSRVVFRTGDIRHFPNVDTPADQTYDLPNAGASLPQSTYYIKSLKTETF